GGESEESSLLRCGLRGCLGEDLVEESHGPSILGSGLRDSAQEEPGFQGGRIDVERALVDVLRLAVVSRAQGRLPKRQQDPEIRRVGAQGGLKMPRRLLELSGGG